MSRLVGKCFNETITLDTSDETDIIECSVEVIGDKNDFLRTPRSYLGRKCKENSAIKNQIISVKGFQFKNDSCQITTPGNGSYANASKCQFQKNVDLNESVKSRRSVQLSTPKSCRQDDGNVHPTLNKILARVKKTPDLPYLSRSKLQNIERWLGENDFENVIGSPVGSINETFSRKKVKSSPNKQILRSKNKKISPDSSSVDSEVEKVLVAVYGDDWKKQNVLKKSKTEPKRSRKINSVKTDYKNKALTTAKDRPERTVRRNIMKNVMSQRNLFDNENNLDNSFSLGVKSLDDSGSSCDPGIKGITSVKKRRKKGDNSSSDSWEPGSTKRKRKEILRKCSSQESKKQKYEAENGNSLVKKTPVKSFLASLSVSTPKRRCHPEAQDFKINFKTRKEELARKLFKLYNAEVFDNNLPEDMNFSWNIKLRGTAGYCYNKKITKSTGQVIRLSRIEFSTKIIDRADRLRDTLIHELCHAASWVIDGVLDGHGSVWTKWSHKAMTRFPELPPIRRCHNYEIAAKYTYRCTGCGYSINRHSKSINIERKRCGYCYGILELFVNRKKRGKGEVPEFDSTRTLPAPNKFALFVKENYQNVKTSKSNAKHAEIMKILSQRYAAIKNSEPPLT